MKRSKADANFAPRPLADQLHDALEGLKRMLQSGIEGGQEDLAKIEKNFRNEDGNPSPFMAVREFEWLGGRAENMCVAALCEEVVAIFANQAKSPDGLTLEACCWEVVNRERQALSRNQYRCTSTSMFHNATMEARRSAASYFVERYEGRLERINELKQKVAAERARA